MSQKINTIFCEAFLQTKITRVKSFSSAGQVMRRVLNEITGCLDEQKTKDQPPDPKRKIKVLR